MNIPYDPLNGGYTFAEIIVDGRSMMTHPFLMVPRIGEDIGLPRATPVHSNLPGAERFPVEEERRPERKRLRVDAVLHLMDGKPGAHVQLICSPIFTEIRRVGRGARSTRGDW